MEMNTNSCRDFTVLKVSIKRDKKRMLEAALIPLWTEKDKDIE